MQTYASKYINITNMTSAMKQELERQLVLPTGSGGGRLSHYGDEFLLESVHINREEPGEEPEYAIDPDDWQLPQYVCYGVGAERTDEQVLYGKVVAWRTSELDISNLIPNFEPQICLFKFSDFTFHDSPDVFETYVREDYLASPAGREFGEEVMRAKLKGEIV